MVVDRYGKNVYERHDIRLNEFGAFNGEFGIPSRIKHDTLHFKVMIEDDRNAPHTFDAEQLYAEDEQSSVLHGKTYYRSVEAMKVLVTDFKAEPFYVTAKLDTANYVLGDTFEITSKASLHSGGPFVDAAYDISVNLVSKWFSSKHPSSRLYSFGRTVKRRHWDTLAFESNSSRTDETGSLTASQRLDVPEIFFGELSIQVAVRDDRGRSIVGRTKAMYRSTDRFVGIRFDHRQPVVDQPYTVDVIVVDSEGVPQDDVPITVKFQESQPSATNNSQTRYG